MVYRGVPGLTQRGGGAGHPSGPCWLWEKPWVPGEAELHLVPEAPGQRARFRGAPPLAQARAAPQAWPGDLALDVGSCAGPVPWQLQGTETRRGLSEPHRVAGPARLRGEGGPSAGLGLHRSTSIMKSPGLSRPLPPAGFRSGHQAAPAAWLRVARGKEGAARSLSRQAAYSQLWCLGPCRAHLLHEGGQVATVWLHLLPENSACACAGPIRLRPRATIQSPLWGSQIPTCPSWHWVSSRPISGPGQLAHGQPTCPRPWGDKHGQGQEVWVLHSKFQGASSPLLGNWPTTFTPTPSATSLPVPPPKVHPAGSGVLRLGQTLCPAILCPCAPWGCGALGSGSAGLRKSGELEGGKQGPSMWAAWALGLGKALWVVGGRLWLPRCSWGSRSPAGRCPLSLSVLPGGLPGPPQLTGPPHCTGGWAAAVWVR